MSMVRQGGAEYGLEIDCQSSVQISLRVGEVLSGGVFDVSLLEFGDQVWSE